MKSIFTTVLLILLLTNITSAQPWITELSKQKKIADNEFYSFYEIQNAFNNYWEGKQISKGKGWKQFKRWENFMEPRVYPSGYLNNNAYWKAYKLQKQTYSLKNNKDTVSNWVPLGPSDTPTEFGGGKRGNGRINCIAFDPNNNDIIWVGTPSGGLWKTTTGGSSWTTLTDDFPTLGISCIAINPNHTDTMYIGTGDRDAGDTYTVGVLRSIDGGLTWEETDLAYDITQQRLINDMLLNPDNPNELIVATSSGIYKSTDAGVTFTSVQSGHFKDLVYKPNDYSVIYASSFSHGGGAAIYKSSNSGNSFSELNNLSFSTSQVNRITLATTPHDANYVYALCSKSSNSGFHSIHRSINEGNSWQEMMDGSNTNLLGWETDGSDVSEGGQGWYDLSLAVSPTNKDEVYVGGVNIWKSTNGGVDFDINAHWYGGGGAEYVHADEHILVFNENNNVLYSGNDGGIYSTSNGYLWTDISDGLEIHQIYRLGCSATNEHRVVTGSQDNGTMRYENGTWNAILGGDGMECLIDYENEDIIYAEYYYGNIFRSNDGGYNFNVAIKPDGSDNGAWVTPYVISPSNPTTLYAGYVEIYKSDNRGDSWTTITNNLTNGSTVRSLAVAPTNENYIYAGTTSNIYCTKNGGTSWTNISSGLPNTSYTYIAVSNSNPETIWVTCSGFNSGQKVYRSDNAGNTWTNISDNLPNIPANCIVHQKNTDDGIYVGTDLGVYYTNNHMTGWKSFNNGLPNVIVNELEIHENSHKLRAATFGRGLWESPLYLEPMAPTANFNFSMISDCSGEVSFINQSMGYPFTLVWNFGDGNTSTETSPTHQYLSSGEYIIQLIVTNNLGADTITDTLNLNVLDAPIANDAQGCEGDSIILTATGSQNIYWYDAGIGGTMLHQGDTFIVTDIEESTTYYVENAEPGATYYGAKADTAGYGSFYDYPYTHYLVFDCHKQATINSVEVYANTAGNRTISLNDNSGNTLQSKTVNIPQGKSRVDLNFTVNPGNNYQLAGPTNPDLYRNSDITDYPYEISDLITITQSSADTDPTGYYYYFYNWEVTEANCGSARTPVEIDIDPLPMAAYGYSINENTYSFNNNSSGADSYIWDFGDGNTSTEENPMHTFTQNGQYYVKLIAQNSCGSDSSGYYFTVVLQSIENLANFKELKIYPNPNTGEFVISFYTEEHENLNIKIIDPTGRMVFYNKYNNYLGHFNKKIQLQSLVKGSYFVNITSNTKNVTKSIIVQ